VKDNLTDDKRVKLVDYPRILRAYMNFTDLIFHAVKLAEEFEFPSNIKVGRHTIEYGVPSKVLLVGMGGSSIGGEIFREWIKDKLEVPIHIHSDYGLPTDIDKNTLIIAISYSGNTEETISAFIKAVKVGCMAVALTSGGILKKLAEKLKVPYVEVPKGLLSRAALPYLFFPLPIILEKLGLDINIKEEIKETLKVLDKIEKENNPEVPLNKNPSKKIARELLGFIPVVYGFRYFHPIAQRMKMQFNENSKVPSFYNVIPQLNHDEISGWEENPLSKFFKLIFIRSSDEPPEIKCRIEVTKDVLSNRVGGVLEIHAEGDSILAKMFSVIYVGDLVSIYLAMLRGVNPDVVPLVSRVKGEVAKRLNIISELKADIEEMISKS